MTSPPILRRIVSISLTTSSALTSQAFLGLTLGCARCHNHKFDPLTARDYYSMVAVFNGLQRPRNGRTELDLPVGTSEELEREALRDSKIEPLRKQIAEVREKFRREFLDSGKSSLGSEALEAFRAEPAKRTDNQKALVAKHGKDLDKEISLATPASVKDEIQDLEARIADLRESTPDLAARLLPERTKTAGDNSLADSRQRKSARP